MRIGFDVSPLHRPHPRGLVRVVDGAVRALEQRGRIQVIRLEPPVGIDLRRWRHRELPELAGSASLYGIHSFVSAFALRGPGKRVQTIHELPWRHGVAENADLKHRLWAALGPLRADRVCCATEHAARDLRARWLPGAGKVRLTPWGVGEPFAPEPPLGEFDEPALGRYRLGEDPLALCLGAVRAKKNLVAAIRGLGELRRRNGPRVQLVVTGEDTPDLRRDLGLVSQLGLSRFVSTPGEIAERDLPALVRLASAVVVLSKSEGFALPVLEAMACGTPVVVSRGSAQAEVAGDAGIAVDATDPASVADGFARAIAERSQLRPRLIARSASFTWERCAAAIEALWGELA
jgi:alpha-1,3-rhamnosyl/mannosyltransferase